MIFQGCWKCHLACISSGTQNLQHTQNVLRSPEQLQPSLTAGYPYKGTKGRTESPEIRDPSRATWLLLPLCLQTARKLKIK